MGKSQVKEKQKRSFQLPDTYVIIFIVVALAALLTYIVPTGRFDVGYKVHDANNKVVAIIEDGAVGEFTSNGEKFTVDASGEETLILQEGSEEALSTINKGKPQAYEHMNGDGLDFKVTQEYGKYISEGEKNGIPLFKAGGEVGFFNFAFEGLVKGDKWGTAVGIIAFILIAGGAFGVILRTGAVEIGILSMIKKTKGAEVLLIPVLFFLFSLGGAIFGMGEEAIPFAMIIVPLVIAMGYDAIVGIMVTYVATQIGFSTSWMNPFSVAIAQGIAGVPVLSGAGFRMALWAIFTTLGMVYTMVYAKKIKKNPLKSVAYESDSYYRENFNSTEIEKEPFKIGHALVLLTLTLGIVWIIWGVDKHGYYIPEIASIFFTIGVVAGIIGVVFKLNNMSTNDIASSFRKGAEDLVGAAIIVGLAQGILLVLGGQSPFDNTVLNTILSAVANLLSGVPAAISAWFMYVFQSVFNFFIVSGSGQAALTMPLMAPLAELVGVTKQVAVLAFQLGDGFTNVIIPTSGCLMGVLGVARLDWKHWFKFQIKFQGFLFGLASVAIVVAVMMGYC